MSNKSEESDAGQLSEQIATYKPKATHKQNIRSTDIAFSKLPVQLQSEAILEENFIKQLASSGYERINLKNLDDLEKNFKTQLEHHNKITLTDSEFNRILTYLEGGGIYEKAKKIRDKFELVRDDETVYIEFLDTKDWIQNSYQVTNQITNDRGRYLNRYDVTILINGLPVVQVELKRRGKEIKEAFNQVVRYKKDSLFVGLLSYIQIFIISNGVNTKYFANNQKLSSKQIFSWTDENNKPFNNLSEFTDTFLERSHLAKMMAKYIVLHNSNKCLMILRPYQYYAAESIVNCVAGQSANDNKIATNGYIWHTTGSGKTLTSFKTAQLLAEISNVDKILFVVDRKDLDYQTTKEFNHFSNGSVSGSESTKSLVKHLGSEQKVIVTTIQKLSNAVKADRHNKSMQKVKEKKCIFIFDECHRSQFGDMHTLITDYFTNHQCFGFTGTPIFAENANKNKTTADLFGKCLHQYIIQDAIADENVLGFSVEYISTFKKGEVNDVDVEAIDTREVFEAEDRVELVANHIIKHHDRKTFNRNFSAIFAVSSIPLLIKYYQEFNKIEHRFSIATIFSFGANEDPNEQRDESSRDMLEQFMEDYNSTYGTNFTTKTKGNGKRSSNDFNAYYIDVAKRVRDKQIDILIVVNMFLTGFDSPLLNTLYVDKNLRYHGLIQAFSRTNRLLNEQKKHGNIVCYRPIKNKVDKAIRLFSDRDPEAVVLMKSYEEYLAEFNKLALMVKTVYPTMESIDALQSEEDKKNFIEIFRALLRVKTRALSFSKFSYADVHLTEQEIEDYTSKYRDLYDQVINQTDKEKTSILDDLDFEIELLRRDDINVDYILMLLRDLDPKGTSFEQDKKFIIQTINNSHDLKSKKELIEAFLATAGNLEGDVERNLESFVEAEKAKELTTLASTENLDVGKVNELLKQYDFTGRLDEEILEQSFLESLGLIKRRAKKKTLRQKVEHFIEKFAFA